MTLKKKLIMEQRGEYILEMLILLTLHSHVIILRISKMLEEITDNTARNSPACTQPERTLLSPQATSITTYPHATS
jgi:hypothetical protein